MHRLLPLSLFLVASPVGAETAIPDEVEVTAAPAIAVRAPHGLDPDVDERLHLIETVAARAATPAQLATALERALVLYRSDDPFSRAQRELARPRVVAVLGRLAARARAAGDAVLAARVLDARWVVSGQQHDPELAKALVHWAEHEEDRARPEALFLARRARRADPSLPRAIELDEELSRNRRTLPARLAVIAGALAFGAGLYASREGHDTIATGLYVASPVLCAGGLLFELSGVPKYTPVSPAELPAP